MPEAMNLNTRIVHSLLDLGIGEQIEHQHITVEKRLDGDFEVWDDGDAFLYDDVNKAADAIEDSLSDDDWPDVERRPQATHFTVVVEQFPTTLERAPDEDDLRIAVIEGLVRNGFNDISGVTVKTTIPKET